MAIYHLHVSIGKKKNGDSARVKYDYLVRRGRYNSKIYEKPSYSQSENMPKWGIQYPFRYWKSADIYERVNAKMFYHAEFSLPIELSINDNIELSYGFCTHTCNSPEDVSGNLPFSMVIHPGRGKNPHCHVMISERANDGVERPPHLWFKRANRKSPEAGGALKTRSLQPKEWLIQLRGEWAVHVNSVLERKGYDMRIDHRSYSDQGLNRIPGIHIGPSVKKIYEKGISRDRYDSAYIIENANRKVDELMSDICLIEEEINKIKEKYKKK